MPDQNDDNLLLPPGVRPQTSGPPQLMGSGPDLLLPPQLRQASDDAKKQLALEDSGEKDLIPYIPNRVLGMVTGGVGGAISGNIPGAAFGAALGGMFPPETYGDVGADILAAGPEARGWKQLEKVIEKYPWYGKLLARMVAGSGQTAGNQAVTSSINSAVNQKTPSLTDLNMFLGGASPAVLGALTDRVASLPAAKVKDLTPQTLASMKGQNLNPTPQGNVPMGGFQSQAGPGGGLQPLIDDLMSSSNNTSTAGLEAALESSQEKARILKQAQADLKVGKVTQGLGNDKLLEQHAVQDHQLQTQINLLAPDRKQAARGFNPKTGRAFIEEVPDDITGEGEEALSAGQKKLAAKYAQDEALRDIDDQIAQLQKSRTDNQISQLTKVTSANGGAADPALRTSNANLDQIALRQAQVGRDLVTENNNMAEIKSQIEKVKGNSLFSEPQLNYLLKPDDGELVASPQTLLNNIYNAPSSVIDTMYQKLKDPQLKQNVQDAWIQKFMESSANPQTGAIDDIAAQMKKQTADKVQSIFQDSPERKDAFERMLQDVQNLTDARKQNDQWLLKNRPTGPQIADLATRGAMAAGSAFFLPIGPIAKGGIALAVTWPKLANAILNNPKIGDAFHEFAKSGGGQVAAMANPELLQTFKDIGTPLRPEKPVEKPKQK